MHVVKLLYMPHMTQSYMKALRGREGPHEVWL